MQTQHAAFAMDHIERESAIAAPCHLVPSSKECAHAVADEVVDAAGCLNARPVAEVV